MAKRTSPTLTPRSFASRVKLGIGISGPIDGELAVVTDLTGAVLDNTSFNRVDLTMIDPSIDLSGARVWDSSVCPDGEPPDDGPIGTCVRGLKEG